MKPSALPRVFFLTALTVCAHAQTNSELPWNTARAQAETAGFLKDLIRLDTRNPRARVSFMNFSPGNESRVAHYSCADILVVRVSSPGSVEMVVSAVS